jgi:RNA polymerase sigma-70 factor (ECF subfamily)
MSDGVPNSAPWSVPRKGEGPSTVSPDSTEYFSTSQWTRTYKHAYSLVQDPADAEDMAQEAYLRLFEAVSAGRKIESCVAWLKAVVRNAAFQHWHETRPDLHIPMETEAADGEQGIVAKLTDPSASVEEKLVDESLVRESLRVLAKLPEAERECVMMYARGYTFAQIAKALGMSYKMAIKTTRKALSKTRRKIDTKSIAREMRP